MLGLPCGDAIAHPEASGERVDTKFELWRELIYEIRGLRALPGSGPRISGLLGRL
jgi:hypothetical protein